MVDLQREALRAGQFAPIAAGKFRTFGGGTTVSTRRTPIATAR